MKAEQPTPAEQKNTPNNETAEPQDAPNFGPITEKEHWQAIKQAANIKEAELKAEHAKATAKLPQEPDYWTPFKKWLQEHHPAIIEGYAAIVNEKKFLLAEERRHYRNHKMRPLLETWAKEDPIGIKAMKQYHRWQTAKQALDDGHKEAMQQNREVWFEAERKLEAIREEERRIKREADFQRRLKLEQQAREEALLDEIGCELSRDLNPDHPDFDREAFEQFCNPPSHNPSVDFNYVLTGPTGTGKSRCLAYMARKVIEWSDAVWVTSARFADLVTMHGGNRRDTARAEMRRLAEASFLFFDDLGAVEFTEKRVPHFYRLMNERYTANLPTYFSTNYGRDGIERMLAPSGNPEDIEVAKAIIRRMIGTAAEPRAHIIQFKSHPARRRA